MKSQEDLLVSCNLNKVIKFIYLRTQSFFITKQGKNHKQKHPVLVLTTAAAHTEIIHQENKEKQDRSIWTVTKTHPTTCTVQPSIGMICLLQFSHLLELFSVSSYAS
jgi:hypothetical protein